MKAAWLNTRTILIAIMLALIVVAFVAGFGLASLVHPSASTTTSTVTKLETVSGAQNSATSTSTMTEFETMTVTEVSNTSSLQPNATALDLSVSIEPIASPQALNITVVASVRNPTSSNITLSSRGIPNPAGGACTYGQIASVNVYLGHLGQGNLSDSKPLALFNPYAAYSCPTYTISNYVLGPGQAMNETSFLYGYWSGSGTNPSNYSFQPFQVGEYTIVVSDAWGQTTFEYFTIAG